jgi:hypothetical protein
MWVVQALAAPENEQRRLFPEFVVAADELALDHEETQAAFLNVSQSFLSPVQREAVGKLDQHLEAMSGPDNAQLWTAEALGTAQDWERLRELAAAVLRAMGWPLETPPTDRGAIYVGPAG